ncbi:MAG: hypothetical protein WB053_04235 [Nitrososphaeraceae archaeon]
MEELSANFDDREADLIIKMTPPVVTNDTLQNQNQKPIIQFKLYGGGLHDVELKLQKSNMV